MLYNYNYNSHVMIYQTNPLYVNLLYTPFDVKIKFYESDVLNTGTELQTLNTGKSFNFICFQNVDTPGK